MLPNIYSPKYMMPFMQFGGINMDFFKNLIPNIKGYQKDLYSPESQNYYSDLINRNQNINQQYVDTKNSIFLPEQTFDSWGTDADRAYTEYMYNDKIDRNAPTFTEFSELPEFVQNELVKNNRFSPADDKLPWLDETGSLYDQDVANKQKLVDINKQKSNQILETGANIFSLMQGQEAYDAKPKQKLTPTTNTFMGNKLFQTGGTVLDNALSGSMALPFQKPMHSNPQNYADLFRIVNGNAAYRPLTGRIQAAPIASGQVTPLSAPMAIAPPSGGPVAPSYITPPNTQPKPPSVLPKTADEWIQVLKDDAKRRGVKITKKDEKKAKKAANDVIRFSAPGYVPQFMLNPDDPNREEGYDMYANASVALPIPGAAATATLGTAGKLTNIPKVAKAVDKVKNIFKWGKSPIEKAAQYRVDRAFNPRVGRYKTNFTNDSGVIREAIRSTTGTKGIKAAETVNKGVAVGFPAAVATNAITNNSIGSENAEFRPFIEPVENISTLDAQIQTSSQLIEPQEKIKTTKKDNFTVASPKSDPYEYRYDEYTGDVFTKKKNGKNWIKASGDAETAILENIFNVPTISSNRNESIIAESTIKTPNVDNSNLGPVNQNQNFTNPFLDQVGIQDPRTTTVEERMNTNNLDQKDKRLLDAISVGESQGYEKWGYESAYDVPVGGNILKPEKPLTQMTLGEVKAYQKDLINATKGKLKGVPKNQGSSAVGKYQIIGPTLKAAMDDLGYDDNTVFTKEVQDNIGLWLLNRRGYKDYKAGKIDSTEFQKNLAKEWASIAVPDTGKSYYGGQPAVDSSHIQKILQQFQMGGLVNLTGYTPGTSTYNNPFNIIPSGNITMKGMNQPILARPNLGKPRLMFPGFNYNFPNADFVVESKL
jgi:hypothetical protein